MKNKQEKVHTIGFSLVSKLNIQLWFRLVGTFLMLNVVFIVASGITLAVLGERQAVQAVRHVENYGLPSAEESTWLFNQGLEVKEQEPAAAGYIFPIPHSCSASSPRRPERPNGPFCCPMMKTRPLQHFRRSAVSADVEVLGTPISVVIHFGIAVWVLKTVFLVLLIWQLVTAIRTMVSRAELIRRVLRPISDLAQQTQTLSQGQGPLSIEEMQTLAGTLDEINAARLDTRIDLDTTQDELKNLAVAINGLLDRMRESYRLQARLCPILP